MHCALLRHKEAALVSWLKDGKICEVVLFTVQCKNEHNTCEYLPTQITVESNPPYLAAQGSGSTLDKRLAVTKVDGRCHACQDLVSSTECNAQFRMLHNNTTYQFRK